MTSSNLPILEFLWRWKVVSAAALIAKFYPQHKPNAAYKSIRRLKRHGLIVRCQLEHSETGVLYCLTAKGFKVVEQSLPELREAGWKTEHQHHDFWVTAVHLGEWLVQSPEKTDMVTEQELRRYQLEEFPSWIPRTHIHRPDGYWKVSLPEGVGTVALEVELKVKSSSWYGVVAQFYNDQPGVFRIVWVVSTMAKAKNILARLGADKNEKESCHTFVLLNDFRNQGWNAPLHFGPESGRSLAFLLGVREANREQSIYPLCLLDTRKYPFATPRSHRKSKTPKSALAGHSPISPGLHSKHAFTKQTGLPRPADHTDQSRRKTQ